MPIFRNMCDAQLLVLPGRAAGDIPTFELHFAGKPGRIDQTRQDLNKLRLTVAFHAGYADDFTRSHFE